MAVEEYRKDSSEAMA